MSGQLDQQALRAQLAGATLLAEGMLTWGPAERRSDRYGLVAIQTGGVEDFAALEGDARYLRETGTEAYDDLQAALALDGAHGQLVCEVTETRPSGHIGDLFHGIFPSTPEIGELIVLGEGRLFREQAWYNTGTDAMGVGLKPTSPTRRFGKHQGSEWTLWLDPRALYRVHEQTVKIFFLPTLAPTPPTA